MLGIKLTATDSEDLSKDNSGLGNVLYQLSSVISLCKKYKLKFNSYYLNIYLDKLEELNFNHKNTIFRNIKRKNIETNNEIILQEYHLYYVSPNIINTLKVVKDKNILIEKSYLSPIGYFNENEEFIQNLFEPTDYFLGKTKDKYGDLFNKDNENIALHFRFNWGTKFNFDIEYISEVIKYLNLKNDNIRLWICSDNLSKAKKLLEKIEYYCYFVENEYDYEDLWTLSLCKYHILNISTFSWWGAYLCKDKNKKVLYPQDYPKFYKRLKKRFNIFSDEDIIKNIYPENWIKFNKNYIIY